MADMAPDQDATTGTGSARGPVVALVGRQNVGKSTLVNRLFGRRETIAHEQPGVTRDRIEVPVQWRDRTFTAVDTGGFVSKASGIEALVARQAERAAATADLVVLVVDAQTGPQEEDSILARRLRRERVPVLVVVNKVDTEQQEPDATEFHSLGLGEPVAVSALHGRASGDLLDRILDLLPEPTVGEPEVEGEPSFALVGRPNVGKSSLFNRLVGEERSVVYEQAGTTRDAVDAVVRWPAGPARFVDTAGLRRGARMQGIDYYGLVRAARAIDRAHVALLVVDASEGLTSEDKHVAARVVEAGRALVVAANKWDLVASDAKEQVLRELGEELVPFASPPVLRVSALTGQGVGRLPDALLRQHERWARRVPTSEVNRVLEQAQDERPPPRGVTRFRYGTQVSAGPPSFVLFGGRAPDPSYRRFLENRLRRAFDLQGVPVRIRFRPRKGARGAGSGRRR
jgi:GTPase